MQDARQACCGQGGKGSKPLEGRGRQSIAVLGAGSWPWDLSGYGPQGHIDRPNCFCRLRKQLLQDGGHFGINVATMPGEVAENKRLEAEIMSETVSASMSGR